MKVWHTELEAIAQRWADQCTFGHDSTRDKLDGTSVGFIHHDYHVTCNVLVLAKISRSERQIVKSSRTFV